MCARQLGAMHMQRGRRAQLARGRGEASAWGFESDFTTGDLDAAPHSIIWRVDGKWWSGLPGTHCLGTKKSPLDSMVDGCERSLVDDKGPCTRSQSAQAVV